MTRKPIQISYFGGNGSYYPRLHALCDDGSIWVKNCTPGTNTSWFFYEDIPQYSLDDNGAEDAEGICAHCNHIKKNRYMKCASCGSKENKP